MSVSIFVTCPQGIEPLLQEELHEMGIESRPSFRGVYIDDSRWETIYRINYGSRLASRVLLPLLKFKCNDRESLYRGADQINWGPFIRGNRTIAIDANVQHPEFRNSLFAAQVVKDAICDQFRAKGKERPSVDTKNPDVQLNLFISNRAAIISLDTSGAALYKRGYRQDAGPAPLQESVAAALLRLADYKGDEIFVDPCCGSGTILIEAALIATKTPPGYLRHNWGFQNHPEYSMDDWLKVKNAMDAKRQTIPPQHIMGADIDRNLVQICKRNLRASGMHPFVEVIESDLRRWTPSPAPNMVMTNPPHGLRMGEDLDQLKDLYESLGEFMKRCTTRPAKGFVFTGNLELGKTVGLAPAKRHIINNSGVDSRLLEFDLYD